VSVLVGAEVSAGGVVSVLPVSVAAGGVAPDRVDCAAVVAELSVEATP
jgi:hypothetical protein